MTYQSFAQWPAIPELIGLKSDNYISEDNHPSKIHAQAVCDILCRDGFGGKGKIFPVKTWIGKWIIEYENDTGDREESFTEWWTVNEIDGVMTFEFKTEKEAELLCALLNRNEGNNL